MSMLPNSAPAGLVTLAHGNGGRLMREVIDGIFVRHLNNEILDAAADAAVLPQLPPDRVQIFTTDGFTVDPLVFPGGDIGTLAVHGTVNDLCGFRGGAALSRLEQLHQGRV